MIYFFNFTNSEKKKCHFEKKDYILMSMLMIFNMVLSTFFHVLSLKYSTLKIFVSVQLVAKVTAFPAMTASPATSMTSYTSTGYGPAAKVPRSPTGSLGGCTSPDRYIITASLNWAQCGKFRNFLSPRIYVKSNSGGFIGKKGIV